MGLPPLLQQMALMLHYRALPSAPHSRRLFPDVQREHNNLGTFAM